MNISHIPYQETGYFSKTMVDYLAQKDTLRPFYHRFPSREAFLEQLLEKQASFSQEQRKTLVAALQDQYQGFQISEATESHISSLEKETTFTITTGHQLNLFTGPLYFLYKIISVINLCETLKEAHPTYDFVPIYWMASEDHDFDEIKYFQFQGGKIQWNTKAGGPVGRLSTEGLAEVCKEFAAVLGSSKNAAYLQELFYEGYCKHNNLADATRYIANELFASYGLVIVDGDHAALKHQLIPFVEQDVFHQTSYKAVQETNQALSKEYAIQVNPREINVFYILDGLRERILFDASKDLYSVHQTDIIFTQEELQKEITNHPERFSPNALMRPLYQEVILPNLCYIGGGGELAYWLQLKSYFDTVSIPFPILLLRNSAVLVSVKQEKKLQALGISIQELFLPQHQLLANKVLDHTQVRVDFSTQKAFLQEHFDQLRTQAHLTDRSFVGAVNAQEQKQIKGLENLEKRLIKAEKRRQEDLVQRITALQDELFPHQSLEERQRNFSEFYKDYGPSLIPQIKEALDPLALHFTAITLH